MKKYISTRNKDHRISFAEALLRGTAKDGGLPVPMNLPENVLDWDQVINWSYQRLASEIISLFVIDFSREEIDRCVSSAYNSKIFFDNEIVKLKSFDNSLHILELFHGPTAAFKDIGLQILPQFINMAVEKLNIDKQVCVLTATSGDTGSAAIYGFGKSKKAKTITVYPAKGISPVQQAQMDRAPYYNKNIIQVDGYFDVAQKAVKECLGDHEFRTLATENGTLITAANSMNIGRLIPQIVYYVYSYAKLIKSKKINKDEPCDVAVPSGNFGNILAAWYAGKLGVPFRTYICASNKNNVLADFFKTGCYDCRREFMTTLSPSMDILVSSNLERLLYHLSGDCSMVDKIQKQLHTDKQFNFDILNSGFKGDYSDDSETLATISSFYKKHNYLLDPHTAVAISVVNKLRQDDVPVIVAATASPLKFSETVLQALGEAVPNSALAALNKVAELAHFEVPSELKRVLNEQSSDVVKVKPEQLVSEIKKIIMNNKE